MTATKNRNWPMWNLTTTIHNICCGTLHDYALEGEIGQTIVGIGDQAHRVSDLCRKYIDDGFKPADTKYGRAIWALARSAGTAGDTAVVRFQERGPRHEARDRDTVDKWRDDLGNIRLLAATHPDEWDKVEPAGLYPDLEDPTPDPNTPTLIEHKVRTLHRLSARVDDLENRVNDIDTWKPDTLRVPNANLVIEPEEDYADVAMPLVDHSKPKPNPQGWDDVDWNLIDYIERATGRFLKAAGKKSKRRDPVEVKRGIADVRMGVNNWQAACQSRYPNHPLTKACGKIVAETAYEDITPAHRQTKRDVYWVRFRNNVNALNLECDRSMREPETPKTGVKPTKLGRDFMDMVKGEGDAIGYNAEQTGEPESYPMTALRMKGIRELRDALSQSLSVIQHIDDEARVNDAIRDVREANVGWLGSNQKDLPRHAITKAGVNVATVVYSGIDSRDGRESNNDDWKTFKSRVETMRRACNMSIFSD